MSNDVEELKDDGKEEAKDKTEEPGPVVLNLGKDALVRYHKKGPDVTIEILDTKGITLGRVLRRGDDFFDKPTVEQHIVSILVDLRIYKEPKEARVAWREFRVTARVAWEEYVENLRRARQRTERRKAKKRTSSAEDEIRNLFMSPRTKKDGIYRISLQLRQEFNFIACKDSDELLLYNEGIYGGEAEALVAQEIQKIIDKYATLSIVKEVIAHIKRQTYKSRSQLVEPKDKLCLKNGVLDIRTGKVEPHSPEYFFLSRIPVDFVATAKCMRFMKFLSEVVHPDDIPTLQELMGYCLYKGYPLEKAFMLLGSGANGKSVFIKTLIAFLGLLNCSAEPLQKLGKNRFAVAELYGKLANTFPDLSTADLTDTSWFKMLVSGEMIRAERKNQHPFRFTNFAKLIFSANQIPRTDDNTDAFFRRWIIIIFPNQFLGTDADTKLTQKLTTPEELSGILNFAIKGLLRLLKNEEFSTSQSIAKVRDTYLRESDSVSAYVQDCLEVASSEYIPKKELYSHYCAFSRENCYPVESENKFHGKLQASIKVIEYKPDLEIDGKKRRVTCWRGIRIIKDSDKEGGESTKTPTPLDKSIVPYDLKAIEEKVKTQSESETRQGCQGTSELLPEVPDKKIHHQS